MWWRKLFTYRSQKNEGRGQHPNVLMTGWLASTKFYLLVLAIIITAVAKYLSRRNLRKEGFFSSLKSRMVTCHSGMIANEEAGWSHCICSQEVESEQ